MNLHQICEESVALMGNTLSKLDAKNRDVYAQFLAQTYLYVRHSTRMLAFAAALFPLNETHHFRRFTQHIAEEGGHETLALRDLEFLGYSIDNSKESPMTRMLWETQYYKIEHISPISLMGYILVLEVFSAKYFPSFLQELNNLYGEKCVKFVKVHAEEDPDHIDKAFQLIEKLPTDQLPEIIMNMRQSALAYSEMLKICGSTSI